MRLKFGGTRVVLLIGRFAVKFPLPVTFKTWVFGVVSNYKEFLTYKTLGTRHHGFAKPYFCFFGLLLVQERLHRVGSVEASDYLKAVLNTKLNIPRLELHKYNFGFSSNGTFKLCDYGVNIPVSDRGWLYRKLRAWKHKHSELR